MSLHLNRRRGPLTIVHTRHLNPNQKSQNTHPATVEVTAPHMEEEVAAMVVAAEEALQQVAAVEAAEAAVEVAVVAVAAVADSQLQTALYII